MSTTTRISRYQKSIENVFKNKSSFSENIKSSTWLDDISNECSYEASIILLTILHNTVKQQNIKMHHGYYMASGINLLIMYIYIIDNLEYYKSKCNISEINSFLTQIPVYVNECLELNLETLTEQMDKNKYIKVHKRVSEYLKTKMLNITQYTKLEGNQYVHKTDIITYKFADLSIINNNYKKIKLVTMDILINNINKTYGNVCQCAFVIGWLLGLGDEKMIQNLERLGTHLGFMIKLSRDFEKLERDVKYVDSVNNTSSNIIVNHGIHNCFKLFMESKTKLIEGCLILKIRSDTIKEVIDFIERRFDFYLNNADLELESRYSSFSNRS